MDRVGRRVVQVELNPEIQRHVERGDFVISMRSFQGGIEVAKESGCISSAYCILMPRTTVNARYFAHLLKCAPYIQALQSTSNLVRDGQAMRFENFTLVDLPVVPSSEQEAIANFLDRKTVAIDALISKKERLVELLQEKRQALITQTVTKGLDSRVPTTPGVPPFVGAFPRTWETWTVRDLLRMRHLRVQDGNHGELHPVAADYVDDGIPFLMANNVRRGSVDVTSCRFIRKSQADSLRIGFAQAGDILLTHKGTIGEVGILPELRTPYAMLTPQVKSGADSASRRIELSTPRFVVVVVTTAGTTAASIGTVAAIARSGDSAMIPRLTRSDASSPSKCRTASTGHSCEPRTSLRADSTASL